MWIEKGLQKNRRYVIGAAALCTASLTLATTVQAQSTVTRNRFQGDVAQIFCFGTDPVTGVYTEVFASCLVGRILESGGRPVPFEQSFVVIFQFDPNTGEIADGFAELDECSIDRLESAMLSASDIPLTFFDADFNIIGEGEADVDLMLAAFGDTTRERFRTSFMADGFSFRFDSMARVRNAEVNGDVTIEGTDVTSSLECFGVIVEVKESQIEIARP